MSDVTRVLSQIESGDPHAAEQLLPLDVDLLALDEALDKLQAKDPRKAAFVKLRFFAGLTNDQAASALGIAASTADLDWAYAKSWLRAEISREPRPVKEKPGRGKKS